MMNLSNNRKKVRVEIYSKPDCHLCDDVKAVLKEVQKKQDFEIVEVNILHDQALYDIYKEQIPVVFLNGKKIFKYRIDREKFLQHLARA